MAIIMTGRIRNTDVLLEAVAEASTQIADLLKTETNSGWKHDHLGVLNGAARLLDELKADPSNEGRRRNLGRLVMDNGGIDFPEQLQTMLLKISTANLRD